MCRGHWFCCFRHSLSPRLSCFLPTPDSLSRVTFAQMAPNYARQFSGDEETPLAAPTRKGHRHIWRERIVPSIGAVLGTVLLVAVCLSIKYAPSNPMIPSSTRTDRRFFWSIGTVTSNAIASTVDTTASRTSPTTGANTHLTFPSPTRVSPGPCPRTASSLSSKYSLAMARVIQRQRRAKSTRSW